MSAPVNTIDRIVDQMYGEKPTAAVTLAQFVEPAEDSAALKKEAVKYSKNWAADNWSHKQILDELKNLFDELSDAELEEIARPYDSGNEQTQQPSPAPMTTRPELEAYRESLLIADCFRGVDELQGSGKVELLIEGFLMKGAVTFFGGPPESGKSLVAMSVAKSLSTGQPLFGKLKVVEPAPVLWLAAESGDSGLKIRCKDFRITNDKTKFVCRTLSQGPMLGLEDPNIETFVRKARPVVVLETAIRFGGDGDENSASDTNKIAGAVFHLISYGARAVKASGKAGDRSRLQ